MENETQNLINYKQAAKFLGLSIATLYTMVSRRKIPHYRFSGRTVRFNIDELRTWTKQRLISMKE